MDNHIGTVPAIEDAASGGEVQERFRGWPTPGPWEISAVRTVDGNPMVVGGEGQAFGLVAECVVDEDARLIAAAPDLLASLAALCDDDASYHGNEIHITCDNHGDAIQRLRVARDAIAKARGD